MRRGVGSLLLLLLLTSCASTRAEKGWRKRKRKWRQAVPSAAACCAARVGACGSRHSVATCCRQASPRSLGDAESDSSAGGGGWVDTCASQPSRLQCEASVPSTPQAGREVCVWIGGQCTSGTSADCAERWHRVNWYGELDGFESQCNLKACPGFVTAFTRYAAAHRSATRRCS